MTSENHRVLKFRPRTLAQPPAAFGHAAEKRADAAARDLSGYEMDSGHADDYRHRMMANAAAIVFTLFLTGAGIWLAIKLADLRNTQDCVLMGRRDCAHISSPKG